MCVSPCGGRWCTSRKDRMSETLMPIERATNGVVTLTLAGGDRGIVVLNRAMIESIDRSLDEMLAGGEPDGFVLASDGRVFVAGADLSEIMSLDDAGLHAYLELGARVFGRIAGLGCTTVAAINGAALGGGLELAMHCDVLIAARSEKPYAVGLPEAGLSICPGWGGTNLLPARMGSSVEGAERAIRMTMTGKPFKSAEEASEAGLVDELVEAGSLAGRAAEVAADGSRARTGGVPRFIGDADVRAHAEAALGQARSGELSQAAAAVAACVEAGLNEGWEAALALERSELCRLRHTDEGRGAIEAFFAKTTKKKSG